MIAGARPVRVHKFYKALAPRERRARCRCSPFGVMCDSGWFTCNLREVWVVGQFDAGGGTAPTC